MNLKSLAIFLAIFILGCGAGFLISGRLTKSSIEAAKNRETTIGFQKDLYKYLKPNENQKQIIDSIVADYLPKIKEERAISRMYQKHLRDSMFTQIQKLLDSKQKVDLKKFEKEKLIKKQETKYVKQKDTLKQQIVKNRKEQFESFKQSLSPQQKITLDSILDKKPKKLRNPEMNKEIRQYTRNTILPVLRKYRSEFEDELSNDEKLIISDLRQKRMDLIKSELLNIGDDETKEKQTALLLEAKNELSGILVNHKKALDEVADNIKPDRDQWIKDIESIKLKYYPDYKFNSNDEFRNKEKNAIDFLLLKGDKRTGQRFKRKR